MALRWEEAGVIVTCGDPRTLEEAPDDAIVIALKPEEADEPETIESVRNLVLDRTIERRRRILSDVYELGLSMPEPVQEELGSDAEEARQAEQSLLESLREHDDEEDASDRDWGDAYPPLTERGLWLGGEPGGGVRIFISHVEELVVHN